MVPKRLVRLLACFLCLFCLSSKPATASVSPLELGLVIGNNHRFGDSARDLHYADDDALEAAAWFRLLHPDGRLWMLAEPDAETLAQLGDAELGDYAPPTLDVWLHTLEDMREVVRQARAAGPRDVSLLVHFSGHGERDASLHFVDGLLPARAFRNGLAWIGADRIFALMDGCYLGGVARGDGPEAINASIFRDVELQKEEVPAGLGLIGATSVVLEEDFLARGVMTLVALSGLAGTADLDDDGRLSFLEIGRYMASQLRDVQGGPELVVVPPRRDRLATVVDLADTVHFAPLTPLQAPTLGWGSLSGGCHPRPRLEGVAHGTSGG